MAIGELREEYVKVQSISNELEVVLARFPELSIELSQDRSSWLKLQEAREKIEEARDWLREILD